MSRLNLPSTPCQAATRFSAGARGRAASSGKRHVSPEDFPEFSTNIFDQPFVELFIPSQDWKKLQLKLDGHGDEVTYFAGNMKGDFETSDADSINPVTWGVFRGKE